MRSLNELKNNHSLFVSIFTTLSPSNNKTMKFNASIFKDLGLTMAGNEHPALAGTSKSEKERTFKSFFGIHWNLCETTWALLDNHGKYKRREPRHLLWTLVFYKVYATEKLHCKIVKEPGKTKPAEKTFRMWVRRVSEELADLNFLVVRMITYFFKQMIISLLSKKFTSAFFVSSFYADSFRKQEGEDATLAGG